MKILIHDCGKNEISILKDKTDLLIGFELGLNIEKLLVDLETKEVQLSKVNFGKMIFSNIDQFLTYYEGINMIKESTINENDNQKI